MGKETVKSVIGPCPKPIQNRSVQRVHVCMVFRRTF